MIYARRPVTATIALAAGALLAATLLNATHTASAAPKAHRNVLDTVRISPGNRLAGHAMPAPLSTAQCRRRIHIACYGPHQIQRAYDLPALYRTGTQGRGTTIAIVDAFGSPTIGRDLARFDARYHLPAPPALRVLRPAGNFRWKPNATDEGWAGETTLDVEWAHAIAPKANLLLVETPKSEEEGTTGFPQIVAAEKYVINHHLADVISQSFSATEQTFPNKRALLRLRGAYKDAAYRGVTVLTASGDSGAADSKFNEVDYYLHPVTSWPDSDPLVTGIGGTKLTLGAAGRHLKRDVVWNDTYNRATQRYIFGENGPNPLAGGGGLSTVFARPYYQYGVRSIVGRHRGVPDISMSGACSGAVYIYQSFPGQNPGWYPTCGTSESTPLFAGIVALAAQRAHHGLGLINPALYRMSARHERGIVDIRRGNTTVAFIQHGKGHTVQGGHARRGYDIASGVGTVDARYFVPELARAAG